MANVIWQKKYSPQNDARYFSDNHDFILCYKKNDWKINPLQRTEEQISRYKNPDNDKRGPWKPSDFSVKSYSAAYDYPITLPSGRVVNPPASRCWVTSEKRFKEMIEDDRIWFGENGNNVPSIKKFLSEVKEGTTPLTIWPYDEVGHNQTAKQELKSVLNENQFTFDSPKPVKLIQKIINISINAVTNPNGIILDFFAGSGTTGHAVLELNKEDGGRRQFILVTNNEVTDKTRRQLEADGKTPEEIEALGICRAVTYPRLQKVIEGYSNLKGEKVAGTGGKLRYFHTDFVPAEGSSDQIYYNLRRRCTEMLCFRENVFTPLAAAEQYEIFRDHDRVLAILHDEHPRHKEALRDALHALAGVSDCKLYVFSLDP